MPLEGQEYERLGRWAQHLLGSLCRGCRHHPNLCPPVGYSRGIRSRAGLRGRVGAAAPVY
jgi:hypothetical protein